MVLIPVSSVPETSCVLENAINALKKFWQLVVTQHLMTLYVGFSFHSDRSASLAYVINFSQNGAEPFFMKKFRSLSIHKTHKQF